MSALPPLRRRLVELLLAGAMTPLLYPLSWLLRRAIGLDDAELGVGFTFFWLAWVINDPHFTVTYLLFYEDARARAFGPAFSGWQRARWWIAGVVVPALLGAWGVWAVTTRSAPRLGAMIQLMFALVGWHYVKQGFGVMAVLSARRGVRYTPLERWAMLAHCFAGWAYAWAEPADPGREVEEKGVVYTTIAHGPWLERATLAAFVLTGVALAVVLVRKRVREGALPVLGPLLAMLCSVWAWSVWSSADPLVRYMIPALHSVQYLYFVGLMKGGEARERQGPPWFERSARTRLGLLAAGALALGALLFHFVPTALDEVLGSRRFRFEDLGPTPWFAALYTFVNVHHYFMDHVIWRRENPRARYLFAAPAAEEAS